VLQPACCSKKEGKRPPSMAGPVRVLPFDLALASLKKRGQSDDEDIKCSSFQVNLLDQYSLKRLEVPVRGQGCDHQQCFELQSYAAWNATRVTPLCPLCSLGVDPATLYVDELFLRLLAAVPKDVDKVTLDADNGTYTHEGDDHAGLILQGEKTNHPDENNNGLSDEQSAKKKSNLSEEEEEGGKKSNLPAAGGVIDLCDDSDDDSDVVWLENPGATKKPKLSGGSIADADDVEAAAFKKTTNTQKLLSALPEVEVKPAKLEWGSATTHSGGSSAAGGPSGPTTTLRGGATPRELAAVLRTWRPEDMRESISGVGPSIAQALADAARYGDGLSQPNVTLEDVRGLVLSVPRVGPSLADRIVAALLSELNRRTLEREIERRRVEQQRSRSLVMFAESRRLEVELERRRRRSHAEELERRRQLLSSLVLEKVRAQESASAQVALSPFACFHDDCKGTTFQSRDVLVRHVTGKHGGVLAPPKQFPDVRRVCLTITSATQALASIGVTAAPFRCHHPPCKGRSFHLSGLVQHTAATHGGVYVGPASSAGTHEPVAAAVQGVVFKCPACDNTPGIGGNKKRKKKRAFSHYEDVAHHWNAKHIQLGPVPPHSSCLATTTTTTTTTTPTPATTTTTTTTRTPAAVTTTTTQQQRGASNDPRATQGASQRTTTMTQGASTASARASQRTTTTTTQGATSAALDVPIPYRDYGAPIRRSTSPSPTRSRRARSAAEALVFGSTQSARTAQLPKRPRTTQDASTAPLLRPTAPARPAPAPPLPRSTAPAPPLPRSTAPAPRLPVPIATFAARAAAPAPQRRISMREYLAGRTERQGPALAAGQSYRPGRATTPDLARPATATPSTRGVPPSWPSTGDRHRAPPPRGAAVEAPHSADPRMRNNAARSESTAYSTPRPGNGPNSFGLQGLQPPRPPVLRPNFQTFLDSYTTTTNNNNNNNNDNDNNNNNSYSSNHQR